jgi:amino acid adenylation domain-containing protein
MPDRPSTDSVRGRFADEEAGARLSDAAAAGPAGPGDSTAPHYLEWDLLDVDTGHFRRAWGALVTRHPALRTVKGADGRPQTAPVSPRHLEVPVLDLRAADTEDADRRVLAERARMAARAPGGTLPYEVRVTLLPGGQARVQLAVDATATEHWSLVHVLLPDLACCYAAPDAAPPRPAPLGTSDVPAEVAAVSRRYWRERVASLPPPPDLPLAGAGAPAGPLPLSRTAHPTPPGTWDRLTAAACAHGCTATETVTAAFAEVLRTWSSAERFTVAHLFVRLAPTRFSLLAVEAVGGTFATRACALAERLAADGRHRHVSPLRVLCEEGAGRDGGGSFPVLFAGLLDQPQPAAFRPAVAAAAPGGGASLTVQVVRGTDGALETVWDRPEGHYPPGMIEAMAGAFADLLGRLAAGGPEWTAEPLVLVPEDQLALQATANATRAPLPAGLLHTPVAEHARLRPGSPAVITSRRTLDYDELNRRMNQVGRRLRALGARPGRLVAVVMDKGWEQIVALHGILASGAAYLPIDPAVPAERLHRLLDDGMVELVLTTARTEVATPWPGTVRRLRVDTDFDDVDDGPLEQVQQQTDLAYVIHTSGSTGTPKGVMVDHLGALNTLHDVNRRVGIGPGDRCLALSGVHFDLSVYDAFGVTAAGGAVVIPDPSPYPDPGHWADLMGAADVTFVLAVAALLEMLTTQVELGGGRERIAALRTVIQAGDVLPVTLPDRIRALNPRTRVFNAAGPVETCVLSVIHPVGTVDPDATRIPIGRPMANQRYHVLDERLRPRPVWVPGEIHVAGEVGLARGYWPDEPPTAERFRSDPDLGERVYASGDMARYLPNGDLEMLGRKDFQVKIQGVRIELGEIEVALAGHPSVLSAVAVADRSVAGLPVLRAYVVAPDGGRAAAQDELRAFLAEKLPAAMVPATVTALDRFPLTANGKIDRLALTSGTARPAVPRAPAGRAPSGAPAHAAAAPRTARPQNTASP